MKILILGAVITGLTAAGELADALVFEKEDSIGELDGTVSMKVCIV